VLWHYIHGVKKLRFNAVVLAIFLYLSGTHAIAEGPALDIEFTSGGQDLNNGSFSLGWTFTLNSQVTVTALGFYSANKGSLSTSHDVGIYDANCNLVANTTVQPSDTLQGFFRYHTLASPVVLSPGQTYSIAAVTGGAAYLYNPTAVKLDPAVNFGKFNAWQGALQQTATLQCPNFPASTQFYGDFGPTFYISEASDGGGSDKRASATTLFCNRSGDLLNATCTVSVADQGAPPRLNPTGEVQFSATEGSLSGSSCTLQAVSASPGISSCNMNYAPPAGFPIGKAFPVTATYVGDTNFDSSSTSHKIILASCVGTPAKPCPNSVGIGFGDLPAIINKIISMVATCGATDSTQAARLGRSHEVSAGEIPPAGGGCHIIAALGLDVDEMLTELSQPDLEALYNAFTDATKGTKKDALFEYSESAFTLDKELYKIFQNDESFRAEIVKILEKGVLGADYEKIFSKHRPTGFAVAATKKKKKTAQPILVFAKVEKTVNADKTAVVKFKLNKRMQNLVTIFKRAGIATMPLKSTLTATQKKRRGKAKLSQSVDVVLK